MLSDCAVPGFGQCTGRLAMHALVFILPAGPWQRVSKPDFNDLHALSCLPSEPEADEKLPHDSFSFRNCHNMAVSHRLRPYNALFNAFLMHFLDMFAISVYVFSTAIKGFIRPLRAL